MDTLIDTVAQHLAAIVGDALNDLEFSALVNTVVADRMTPARW